MSETNQQVISAASVLFRPDDVIEVRVPKAGREKTISGCFRDLDKLAAAAAQLENRKYPGVYWTLNPIDPALLARAENKVLPYANETTNDKNIVCRRWLLIDLDPQRPAGISSSDSEKAAAMELAIRVRAELRAEGWPDPVYADSGNGAHLLYRIDLPNDPESEDLLKRTLQALAVWFDTDLVQVDKTVFNASRIAKVYGTTARKGDNTAERPHRLSRLLEVPETLDLVTHEQLRVLASTAPQKQDQVRGFTGGTRGAAFDLGEFLARHGVRYRPPVPWDGGRKFVLLECPFDAAHKAPDAAAFEKADGQLGFKCLHNSCADYHWREFRERFEGPRRPFVVPPGRGSAAAAPAVEREPEPQPKEPEVTPEDVAAAIDAVIAADDLLAAIRLALDVAKLPVIEQVIAKTRLKEHFKTRFSVGDFERAIRDAAASESGSDGTGQNPPAATAAEEGEGPEGPDLTKCPLTDAGNGERMVRLFGQDIRYCTEMKRWLVWDVKRWAVDEVNVMRQKGKEMARLLYQQATRLADADLRRAIDKHARASESYAAISNALGQAATEHTVPISVQKLDSHPYLLNCPNGVIDLRNGKLIKHNRDFLITKLCPVEYDPNAKCPTFQRFIEWAMGGPVDGNPDAELSETTTRLVAFLQRAIGYGLTGDVSEKAVFVFYGEGGNNGKTTLLTLFRDLLGRDYANLLLIDTLMSSKQNDTLARADMADLRGARFVSTSEVGKEDKLNDQRVKFLTQGMGWIKAKRLYENPMEFEATHKLYMDCNYRPRVTGQDAAIWNRLKLVPFVVTIDEAHKDLHLSDKLRAELPGILAWAVRGAMLWYREGLGEPPEVSQAGGAWREHDDPLREFLDDYCTVEEGLFVPVADLISGYLLWAKENGERFPLARRAFNEALVAKGFKQDRKRLKIANEPDAKKEGMRAWFGLELKIEVVGKLRRYDRTDSDHG